MQLLQPQPGSLAVSPKQQITLRHEGHDDLSVKISGEWAVKEGKATKGYVKTDSLYSDNNYHTNIRKEGGWPHDDILVQAWSGCESIVNSRFFIKGASIHAPKPLGYNRAEWIGSGFIAWKSGKIWKRGEEFEVGKELGGGRPTESGFVYFPSCNTIWGDGELHDVPGLFSDSDWQIVRTSDGFFMLGQTSDRVWSYNNEYLHYWDVTPDGYGVADNWIHLDFHSKTAHLPIEYEPARNERDLSSWFLIDNPREGANIFGDGIHICYTEDYMIAKHDPEPLFGEFDAMLWEDSDIDEPFEDIQIVDDSHVVVNDSLYLNTRRPDITHV